jgi:hypothetical protein
MVVSCGDIYIRTVMSCGAVTIIIQRENGLRVRKHGYLVIAERRVCNVKEITQLTDIRIDGVPAVGC